MSRKSRLFAGAVAVIALIAAALAPIDAAAAAAAPAPATGSIHGIVTAPDGSVPTGQVGITACGPGPSCAQASYDQATGAYSISDLAPGRYHVLAGHSGVGDYYPYVQADGTTSWRGPIDDLTVAAGVDLALSFRLLATATVSGTLTGSDATLTVAHVELKPLFSSDSAVQANFNPATQSWSASGLAPGPYRLRFSTDDSKYSIQYWNAQGRSASATPLQVPEGSHLTGVDAILQRGAAIQGDVTTNSNGILTAAPAGVSVYFYLDPGREPGEGAEGVAFTDSAGHYVATDLYPGTYSVCAGPTNTAMGSCSTSKYTTSPSSPVAHADVVLPALARIQATIEHQYDAHTIVPLWGATLGLWHRDPTTQEWVGGGGPQTDQNGFASMSNMEPGDYLVRFISPTADVDSMWWRAARFQSDATVVHLGPGQQLDLGTVVLPSRDFITYRTSGSDRFDGAVKISQADYPDDFLPSAGVPVVYIANGGNYPDALSAGPAAIAQDGVLLLVTPNAIPASVATELRRLHPQRILVAGGPSSVSAAVFSQLGAFVRDPVGDVARLTGTDRFDASRSIARDAFDAIGAKTVFVTTGNNYPDALSAGPAAGSVGGPVVLVNGLLDHLDAETAQLLADLHTTDVDIAGGPASVSAGIESDLVALLGWDHVHRYAGATRYEASAAIGAAFFPTAETAFLATGTKFPDALAGAPLAGSLGSPIYLSEATCIPDAVIDRIVQGDTQLVWLLGGPASLSEDVYNLYYC